ncbi:hypothetical protein LX86_002229 [Lentzea aerocolonigenes]|nr:hypothetical protein [Lentzea aerocolonigenes]
MHYLMASLYTRLRHLVADKEPPLRFDDDGCPHPQPFLNVKTYFYARCGAPASIRPHGSWEDWPLCPNCRDAVPASPNGISWMTATSPMKLLRDEPRGQRAPHLNAVRT